MSGFDPGALPHTKTKEKGPKQKRLGLLPLPPMQESTQSARRFSGLRGKNAILLAVSLMSVAAAGAFLMGYGSDGLGSLPDTSGTSAQILQQESVATIAGLDSDEDGLTDLDEVRYLTDPKNADTDGDGFDDGLEVRKGFDPTTPPAEGVDQSTAEGTQVAVDTSFLDRLGLSSIKEQVDGLNVGGLGGVDPVAAGDSVASAERLAELEIDKLFSATSNKLPNIDTERIKVSKNNEYADKENYYVKAFTAVVDNNPFPAGYSMERFLEDVQSNNRPQLESLKVSLEIMVRELDALEVPSDMLTEHIHALSIGEAARDAVQMMLDSNGGSDETLFFMGRTVFLWNEIGALLREYKLALGV